MRTLKKIISFLTRKGSVYYYLLGIVLIGLSALIVTVIYPELLTGNFVFENDYSPRHSIHIADNHDFSNSETRLNAESQLDQIGMTYKDININDILQSEGLYIDTNQSYMAYSFYIQNTGPEMISVDYHMRIVDVSNGFDDYVRILVIEDDLVYQMYQKADQPDEDDIMPQYNEMPEGIDFESADMVFRNTFHDFIPGEVKLFRVIIWPEEQDPDINDYQRTGNIDVSFNFSIREEQQSNNGQPYVLSNGSEKLWISIGRLCVVELSLYYEEDVS